MSGLAAIRTLYGMSEGARVAQRSITSAGVVMASAITLLLVSGCHLHNLPDYPENYREYAYVTNGDSGTVTVIDAVNMRQDRELPVGPNPAAVIANPKRDEVYVVSSGPANGAGSLVVIDAAKNAVAATVALHKRPSAIDLDIDGKFAYVTNAESNSVSIVDLSARREIAQIGTGEEPNAVRVSADGKTLVVANARGNSVSIVDLATRRVRAVFSDCPGAADVAVMPDSAKAFVACEGGHQVMVVALAKGTTERDRLEAMLDVGRAPIHLALKPDGGEVFVSNSQSNSVSEIDTNKDDVGGAYIIGDGPVSIHVGDGPSAMAFSSSGVLLFVVDSRSSDVAVVRTDLRSLFTIVPTGRGPNAVAVKVVKGR